MQELEAWGARRGGAWGGIRAARAAVRAAAPLAAEGSIGALAVVSAAGAAADEAGAAAAADAVLAALDAGGAAGAAALQRLPELVAALPEHAARLVARAFATGAESQLAAETALLRAVAALNALRGC
ncbi:hypothetical protein EVAR_83762_1 [Eumeta japonica]|uniref:Uncharacterized protein n=1 Tax=Eumeta variegata TaxID=151549 RepID=A0A4C1WFE9_EUMVA|nr:hypothetical protein EVAR_83762_1 [Eumeta japonica]